MEKERWGFDGFFEPKKGEKMANTHGSIPLQGWLPQFFTDYAACRAPPVANEPEPESKFFRLAGTKLTDWFAAMAQPGCTQGCFPV